MFSSPSAKYTVKKMPNTISFNVIFLNDKNTVHIAMPYFCAHINISLTIQIVATYGKYNIHIYNALLSYSNRAYTW